MSGRKTKPKGPTKLALTRRRNAAKRKTIIEERRRKTPLGRLELDGATAAEAT